MTELSRRNALGSIALGMAAAAAPMEGMAQSVPAPAFAGGHQPKPLRARPESC